MTRLAHAVGRDQDARTSGARGAVEAIEGPFLRVARRHSLCEDDAWDALACGFEIAMRHRERIRPETAGAWFATVVRHEALRIRRTRSRDLHLDPMLHEASNQPQGEREPDPRLPALRAAMPRLKPDERRALTLFYALDASRSDDGGRYQRIMRATGWSYTKVNRCLVEGRARLRALLLPGYVVSDDCALDGSRAQAEGGEA